MIKLSSSDRVFALVAAPLAIFAAFWFLIVEPLDAKISDLRARSAALPVTANATALRAEADRAETAAREDLAAAEKLSERPASAAPSSDAARLRDLVAALASSRAHVVSSEPLRPEGRVAAAADSATRSGVCGKPGAARLVIRATYPDFAAAMRRVCEGNPACVPVNVSFAARKNSVDWTVDFVF